MRTVPLHGKVAAGRVALVSDYRYELVIQRRWHVVEVEWRGRHYGPYAFTSVWDASKTGNERQRKIAMHQLIMGARGVDHIDHNGLNNQDDNLRVATQEQNVHNTRPQRRPTTSAFKGVSWDRTRQKWYAIIKIDGRQRNLGRYRSEVEAALAYDRAAKAAWGEFAYLNFPDAA